MDFVKGSSLKARVKSGLWSAMTPVQRYVTGPLAASRHQKDPVRRLEIGPGPHRIDGFETINVVGGPQVDYVGDATKGLSFPPGTFDLIYASHVFEHIAWYKALEVLKDWVRALKPGGSLELWLPDGYKIAKAWVDAEQGKNQDFEGDGWWRFNDEHDPCSWASGRIFSYGDGTGVQAHFNWHIAVYSERRLRELMHQAGLTDIRLMDRSEVRGHDHGWINLGLTGRKPTEH